MGHAKTTAGKATLGALALALLLLTLASPAQAAPTHPRKEALDITGLNHACGVAVDSKGNLYASSAGTNEVKVYDPSHNLLTSIPNSNEPCGLAVTTTGVLYVSEKATGEVVQFKPSKYPFAGTPTYGPREVIDASTKAKGIAVDSFDDALYVAEGDHVSAYVHEMQTLLLENEVTGGSFKLKFGGQETPSLPYNATAAEVQAALEALSSIEPGNVEVAEHPSTLSWTVFFTGKFAYTDVAEIGRDYSLLTGSNPRLGVIETAKGFSGPIGEGALTEATGVASYTAEPANGTPSPIDRHLWVADAKGLGSTDDSLVLFSGSKTSALKLRRELTGAATPDGSLGFGTAGAYLAADPGNIDAKKCAVVGEGACSAGHLFLYDAAHKALDEFDASGEYLGQTKNAAFADAEPTQVAVDRSGGAGDGTLYVTAGATTPASALAFGPLLQPKRETLPEPISHTLANARAVATDFYGNVYAAAGTKVSVFDPKGKALTSFTDTKGTPTDLAVDSTCKVYVLEGETKATYFTPTACPPVSGTTYARQESVVATGSGFRGIAVNPGPSAGKDRLFVTGTAVTREYDSAAKGSGPLNPEFAKDTVPSSALRESIAVNGANGSVYFGVNPHLIYVVDPTGKEILARIDTTVSTSGITGFNPRLAVDQANGHVIEFDGKSKSAREYEAVAGGFVAEFGSFTEELTKQYRVAVDSSCALHEPPLDETTTPTCEEFDPANGTVYVAFDDTNLSHPPFDVNAFGPLEYPEAGEPPVAVTGSADEFGPGAATLHGSVDPKGTLLGECKFEYLTEAEYQTNGETFSGAEVKACAESPAEIGKGNEAVPVHAQVEGLAETVYRFRLVANNAGGSSEGEAVLFGAPQVEALSPLPILYHEATLRAKVNPSGLATEYRFDFVDAQSFEEQGGFEGPETRHSAWTELAAGEAAVQVSAAIVGLAEGTEYRYRAVAKNDVATVEGPTQSFATQVRRGAESCPNGTYRFGLSANLPDCRAYELVTPAQTDGLKPYAAGDGGSLSGSFSSWLTVQRDESAGERLSYFADGTLPGFDGNGQTDGYRAERGAGDHPAGGWQSALFSPSYAQAGASQPQQHGIAADQLYSIWESTAVEGRPGALPRGVYLRTPAGFEALGQGSLGTDLGALSRYVGAGGAHAIFASKEHLEEDAAPSGTEALYDRAAGEPSAEVVSVKPDGSAFGAGEAATYIGASEDGAAVAFRVGGTLYLHREGETTEIAEGSNTFAGISEDGTRVFYVAAAAVGFSPPPPAPLYACDTEAGPCAGPGAHPPEEIAAKGIFALVSPDGSNAFFSSEEAIGEEVNDNGEEPEAGAHNLYAWDGAQTRFVGQLAAADFKNEAFTGMAGMNLAAWTTALGIGDHGGRAFAPTRSTPGGGAFVFQSHARLSAYDNEGVGEIYRYDPAAEEGERLLCVSCDPSGAPPTADALLEDLRFGSGTPVKAKTMIANLTDDGEEVFFQSFDRLLPEDANEVEDVYQWRAKGSGSPECTRPGGCLALISSGQGETPSFLYGMSADGHDVFFRTQEKLVGMDEAGSPSVYDARAGGGIPEPAVPAPCQGDACQGNGTEVPQIPSSATTGSGEAAEAPKARPCAKGKRRVKGRCVKPHKKKNHAKKHHRRAKHDRGGNR